MADFRQYVEGECVYCNHCLPCPVAIDIGQINRLLDGAQQQLTAELRAAYAALPAQASDCTQCDSCEARCPFGVSVIVRMEQAVALFGGMTEPTRLAMACYLRYTRIAASPPIGH